MRAWTESSAAGENFTATLEDGPVPCVVVSTTSGCLELSLTLDEATSLVDALISTLGAGLHHQAAEYLREH